MTAEQDKKEARKIHDAMIAHSSGVLTSYTARRSMIQEEIDKWTKKLESLNHDYSVAPERIKTAQRAIEELNHMEEQAQRAPASNRKSKFAKILELEAQVSRLKKEIQRES